MVNPENDFTDERDAFIAAWHKLEKSIKRIGGILMLFAGGLALALDKPADQYTLLVAAGLFAGGLTLIFRSRRPIDEYAHLYFLQQRQLASQATMAGLAAAFLLYQGMQSNRPLYWIGALLLAALAVWFQWRAAKVTEYSRRFKRDEELSIETHEEDR
ncbi:MAG: hypothetical protein Q9P01_00025 [Anaerolineae bacterium]|nr:hypothetical protein [Anaerolineae bacterium]MDQ7033259.1 hypothetical protein [Anaerolineae bacterium]